MPRQPLAERFQCAFCPEGATHFGYPINTCDAHVGEIEALRADARTGIAKDRPRGGFRFSEDALLRFRLRDEAIARDVRGEDAGGWQVFGDPR